MALARSIPIIPAEDLKGYYNFLRILDEKVRLLDQNDVKYQLTSLQRIGLIELRKMFSASKNNLSKEIFRDYVSQTFFNLPGFFIDKFFSQMDLSTKNKLIDRLYSVYVTSPLVPYQDAKSKLIALLQNSENVTVANLLGNQQCFVYDVIQDFKTKFLDQFKKKAILPKNQPSLFALHGKILEVFSALDDTNFLLQNFRDELQNYLSFREAEVIETAARRENTKNYRYHIFCIGLGVSAEVKCSAVKKLLTLVKRMLKEDDAEIIEPVVFTVDELHALRGSNLGMILSKYEKLGVVLEEVVEQERALNHAHIDARNKHMFLRH